MRRYLSLALLGLWWVLYALVGWVVGTVVLLASLASEAFMDGYRAGRRKQA